MADKSISKEDIHKAVEVMKEASMTLYDLMDPGMSIILSLPEPKAIITPGNPSKMRTMIITKPALVMSVGPKA